MAGSPFIPKRSWMQICRTRGAQEFDQKNLSRWEGMYHPHTLVFSQEKHRRTKRHSNFERLFLVESVVSASISSSLCRTFCEEHKK